MGERIKSDGSRRGFLRTPVGRAAVAGSVLALAGGLAACGVTNHVEQNNVQSAEKSGEELRVPLVCWKEGVMGVNPDRVIIDGQQGPMFANSTWIAEVDVTVKVKQRMEVVPIFLSGRYKVPPSTGSEYNMGYTRASAGDGAHRLVKLNRNMGSTQVANYIVQVFTTDTENQLTAFCGQSKNLDAPARTYQVTYAPPAQGYGVKPGPLAEGSSLQLGLPTA